MKYSQIESGWSNEVLIRENKYGIGSAANQMGEYNGQKRVATS